MRFKISRIKQYRTACLLLAIVSCASRQTAVATFIADPDNGLLQIKTNNKHTVAMQVLPGNTNSHTSHINKPGFLRIKLVLGSSEKMKGSALQQYMNFGIGNSLFAVLAADTLPCIACERIPGISEKEFTYLALFDIARKRHSPGTRLRLLVADTIAGFDTTLFDIKMEAIEKMEVLK